jgi:hypothetical protein
MATNRTFKGTPKPFGQSGHFSESRRHALQAKGIRTGNLSGGISSGMPMPKPKGRLVIKKYRVFKFDELSPSAQEKALQDQRQFESEVWDANDYLISDFKEDIEKYGVSGVDVSYSGFYSQGDGASFTGLVDLRKYLKETGQEKDYAKLIKAFDEDLADDHVHIVRLSNQYSHENTIASDGVNYHGTNNEVQQEADKLADNLTFFAREKSKNIYKTLRDDYEYCMGDENLKENIKANEYEFTEDGKLH